MGFTPEQIKGRIKSVAKQNNADARTLMRIYMMERFLERLAQSEYRDNFIIKGGILVTAMIGVAHRSTMDIDTSMDIKALQYVMGHSDASITLNVYTHASYDHAAEQMAKLVDFPGPSDRQEQKMSG